MSTPAEQPLSEHIAGYHEQCRTDVLPHVPARPGTLLDVGGGVGATALEARARGLASRVGTVDRVARGLPEADFHYSGELDDADFLRSVIAADGPFDTILCLDILEHLVDPWATVAVLHEALAPGGQIVASIPNVRHWRVSGGLFFKGRWELADAGILDRTHLRFFVRDTAVALMTSSGLSLDEVVAPVKARRAKQLAAFSRLTRGKLDSLVNMQYVVRVRKPG